MTNDGRTDRVALAVFAITFVQRLLGAIGTTVTGLNPESHGDVVTYAATADGIARGLLRGELVAPGPTLTYDLWGAFLAPFWLLPGPSAFYARAANALLAAFAVYNVYLLARKYHSRQAGLFAVLPMMFYPSFVIVQTTILRDTFVLFGITTAARFVLVPGRKRNLAYGIAVGAILLATIHREDNAAVYLAALAAGALVYGYRSGYVSRRAVAAGLPLGVFGAVVSIPLLRRGAAYLAYIRQIRAYGRAAYLVDVIPRTIPELVAFSWVGAAYFLYAPFPWMVKGPADLVLMTEGLISIAYTAAGVHGFRKLASKNRSAAVALVVGLAVAAILYGVGTANYGTGMRHRQMFLWVLFLFGGIGIADRVRFAGLDVSTLPRDTGPRVSASPEETDRE